MSDFEKFKEELPSKGEFYNSLTNKKLVTKNINMFLMSGTNLNKSNERLSKFIFKM